MPKNVTVKNENSVARKRQVMNKLDRSSRGHIQLTTFGPYKT